MNKISDVIVTIRCITYNHEPYIRQCLEGFVMQQTNFKFEAVVHDDASTDGTAAIIAEFAEKYPDIIKPLYETENQYSKKDGSLNRIMNAHMRGKYIAMCEGDDYWIDPHKLQKQVDFLEANPEYSLCFHTVKVESLDGRTRDSYALLTQREYTIEELIKEWKVPTCSIVIKKDVMINRPTHKDFNTGDVLLVTTASRYGKLYCIDGSMGVHIMHVGGVSNHLTLPTFRLFWRAMRDTFSEHHELLHETYLRATINLLISQIRNKTGGLKVVTIHSIMREFGIICSATMFSKVVFKLIIKKIQKKCL